MSTSRQRNLDRRRRTRMLRSRGCAEACDAMHGAGTSAAQFCKQTKCGVIAAPETGRVPARRGRYRNQTRPMGARALSGVISAAPSGGGTPPSGPGNTWTLKDAIAAGCCVFVDQQGAYLTCDQQVTGTNHPLHGLEVQVQAVNEQERLATVCHQIFLEKCWRVPLCPKEKAPTTCCVKLGSFERNGMTFTGMIECSDTNDTLHGTPVMTGQPYQKNGQTYVSFDVGGDVSAELPVCSVPPAQYVPPTEQPGPKCCAVENQDGTLTLECDPDPYGWNGLTVQGHCMDTQYGRMCVAEFQDATGAPVQLEIPVCPKIPPTFIPPECCIDVTTMTLQNCSDPSFNGTPVQLADLDEQSGTGMVIVPWSSVPVPMPLCKTPPKRRPPGERPSCPPGTYIDPTTGECVPPPGECPSCGPGQWMAPDGSCVECPPGALIDPATGECVMCPECPRPGECPPCPECPRPGECPPCPECPDGRIPPPWQCCPEDEDCDIMPPGVGPRFPQPGPVPHCDPDDPCCYECQMDGTGTMGNPCNPCRSPNARRGRRRYSRRRRR